MLPLLGDRIDSVRSSAANALARCQDPRAPLLLAATLGNPQRQPHEGSTPAILSAQLHTGHRVVGPDGTFNGVISSNSAAVNEIMRRARAGSPRIRLEAIKILRGTCDPGAGQMIESFAKDPVPAVRLASIEALSELCADAASKTFVSAMSDDVATIKQAAAVGILQGNDRNALELLTQHATDSLPLVAFAADKASSRITANGSARTYTYQDIPVPVRLVQPKITEFDSKGLPVLNHWYIVFTGVTPE